MTARYALLWAIVVSAASLALRAQASVSGTWELEMRWPDGSTSTGTCVFEQKGESLSGTCGGGTDRFPVTGRAVGGDLSWTVDIKQGGADAVMEFAGRLDAGGTTVTGTCRIIGVQGGTFTLKKKGPAT
jgi:hypothetical protein